MKRILVSFLVLAVFVLILSAALGLNETDQDSILQLKNDQLNLTINTQTKDFSEDREIFYDYFLPQK